MAQLTLAGKLLQAQLTIEKARKNSDNPHYRSQYTDLNEVLAVAKAALHPLGLFIAQGSGKDTYGQYVETSIINADDGTQAASRVYLSGNEDNMQRIGAAITYARRFGLKSLLAMEDTDDDGETAVGRGKEENKAKAPRAAVGVNSPKLGGVRPEPKKAVPRELLNKTISQFAKVALDKKVVTQESLEALLASYKVATKEELTDEQANELLAKLKEKVNQ